MSARNSRRSRKRAEAREANATGHRGLLWVRDDLRLHDNPALHAAATECTELVIVFIHDPEDPSPWPLRGAGLLYKHLSLATFADTLAGLRQRLVVRVGNPADVLLLLLAETGATRVFLNRQVEPWHAERDAGVLRALRANGLGEQAVRAFQCFLIHPPWELGDPYQKKADRQNGPRPTEADRQRAEAEQPRTSDLHRDLGFDQKPNFDPPSRAAPGGAKEQTEFELVPSALGGTIQAAPKKSHLRPGGDHLRQPQLTGGDREAIAERSVGDVVETVRSLPPAAACESLALEDLGYGCTYGEGFPGTRRQHSLLYAGGRARGDWGEEMRRFWQPGEKAALARLDEFLDVMRNGEYERPERFRGDKAWTSLLSPYLRFGELSPRTCYFAALRVPFELRKPFVRRLFWRDAAYSELFRLPNLPTRSVREVYEQQRWTGTPDQLKRWQRGKTGFPLVDASMRCLWRRGFIPNYLRHVVAQFLIDYLDLSWKDGFEWFDYTLIDTDVAINAHMWQQGGHSGISQWNFVMHPVFAAKRADPEGDFVRTWLPELRGLPKEYIHCPWEAPQGMLISSRVLLGVTIADRIIVDLDRARKQHAKEVLRVRNESKHLLGRDGRDGIWWDGRWVYLPTRDDFKANTVEFQNIEGMSMSADAARSATKRDIKWGRVEVQLLDEMVKKAGAMPSVYDEV